jgi:hypothetical protein
MIKMFYNYSVIHNQTSCSLGLAGKHDCASLKLGGQDSQKLFCSVTNSFECHSAGPTDCSVASRATCTFTMEGEHPAAALGAARRQLKPTRVLLSASPEPARAAQRECRTLALSRALGGAVFDLARALNARNDKPCHSDSG